MCSLNTEEDFNLNLPVVKISVKLQFFFKFWGFFLVFDISSSLKETTCLIYTGKMLFQRKCNVGCKIKLFAFLPHLPSKEIKTVCLKKVPDFLVDL